MANSRIIKDKDRSAQQNLKRKKKSLALQSGKKITFNDFVYFDSDRPDRIYQIGRVIALTRQYGPALPTIEVEVYYRQADINATFSLGTHPRQVYGSFERQKITLLSVKGKCTVLHRSQIHQFEEYISFDDCFYYEQVFYQSLSRFYTAVPTTKATYLSSTALKILKKQFEYVLCEPEVAYSLPSTSRENSPASTRVGESASPAPEAKPNVGPDAEIDGDMETGEDDEDSDDDEGPGETICNKTKPICTFLFPYRYYSRVREVSSKEPSDVEGLMPPAEIAVGEDFQIELPPYNGPQSPSLQSDGEVLISADPEQRDKALAILEALSGMEFAIPTYFSEFQSRALQEIVKNDFDLEKVIAALHETNFGITPWTKEEVALFEAKLLSEGLKLHTIAEEFPNRSRVEVVRQFYRWKGDMQRLYSKDIAEFEKLDPGIQAIVLENTAQGLAVNLELREQPVRKSRRAVSNATDRCTNCQTGDAASRWYPIPSAQGEDALYCSICSNFWYRYGVHLPPSSIESRKRAMSVSHNSSVPPRKQARKGRPKANTEEPSSPQTKRELTPDPKAEDRPRKFATPINTSSPRRFLKHHSAEPSRKSSQDGSIFKTKVVDSPHLCPSSPLNLGNVKVETDLIGGQASPQLEPEPINVNASSKLADESCQVCHGHGRKDDKLECTKCKLVVHYDCFLLDSRKADWTCDWCTNLEIKNNTSNPTCVICHIDSSSAPTCLKPTNKFNWVHVTCALMMASLFVNKGEVSGVADLDLATWKERCKICFDSKGFKVSCAHCPAHFVHVSCAVSNNAYRLGFENNLAPSVICPVHPTSSIPKAIDGIDSNTRKSFISLHLKSRAPPTLSKEPAAAMPISNGSTYHPLVPQLQLSCSGCGVESSPLWWWPGPRGNLSGTLTPYLPSFDSRFSSGDSDVAPPSTLQCHVCRWNHIQPLPQNTPPLQPAHTMM